MSLVDNIKLAFNCFSEGLDTKDEAINNVVRFVTENFEAKNELDKIDVRKAHENYTKYSIYLHCENGHVLFGGFEYAELN